MRHSRRVRMLRVALPGDDRACSPALTLVRWLDPLRVLARLPTEAGKLVISGTKITMEAPKLSGYTRDSRWYEMTARSAAQDITKPNIVELSEVRAKIETEDKSTMDLSAVDGTFDRKAGMLTLDREIVLRPPAATRFASNEAVIDTGTGDDRFRTSRSRCDPTRAPLNANRFEVEQGRRGDPLSSAAWS